MMGRGRRGGGPPIYLIFMAMRYLPRLMEEKPAVTLGLGGSLLVIHFKLIRIAPSIDAWLYAGDAAMCLMPGAIIYDAELWRLLTGAVRHMSDYHLYWSLGSLASKVRRRRRLSTRRLPNQLRWRPEANNNDADDNSGC